MGGDGDAFERVEQALRAGGADGGFAFLTARFREEKQYPLLFEARLMQKRRELGLPLILTEPVDELPAETRRAYEQGYVEAAREVGSLFLADGDIGRAWPYFRAIGETAPIAAAIEAFDAKDDAPGFEPVIEIAYHERLNPRKGFELVLHRFGICRAISYFDQYPGRDGREDSRKLLVTTLYRELVESLKRTIAQQEGAAPETENVSGLIAGRDWLFAGNNYYTDTSHVVSVIRLCLESDDPELLRRAVELADYGARLGPMFQYRGEPPFEDVFRDHAIYLRALLGEEVEAAIAHFRKKAEESDPDQAGRVPAQVLVGLLARLKRYEEAIDVSLAHLRDVDPNHLACPNVIQLCQMAGDYARLTLLARDQGDLLSFAAAKMQA